MLKGAQQLLKRERPFAIFECTRDGLDDHGIDARDVHDFVTGTLGYQLQLLKDWLSGGPAFDRDQFVKSMVYPFQAFNYGLVPAPGRLERH